MTTKVSVYTFYCEFLNDCMSTKNNKVTYFMTLFVLHTLQKIMIIQVSQSVLQSQCFIFNTFI